jgi:hypothetical protein
MCLILKTAVAVLKLKFYWFKRILNAASVVMKGFPKAANRVSGNNCKQ